MSSHQPPTLGIQANVVMYVALLEEGNVSQERCETSSLATTSVQCAFAKCFFYSFTTPLRAQPFCVSRLLEFE